MKKIIVFLLLAVMFFMPAYTAVHAQGGLGGALSNLNKSAKGTGLEKQGDLATTVGNIIKAVLALVGTIFLILTIYAGILWMTAAGNEERVKRATSIITTAVVGLVIVMAAYAITYFVTTRLGGGTPGTGTAQSGGVPSGGGTANDPGCCVFNVQDQVRTCYVGTSPANCQGQPVSSCSAECPPM